MNELINYLKKIAEKVYLINILSWEMDTIAPEKSYEYLIRIKTKLEMEMFELQTSQEYEKLLNNAINSEEFKKENKYAQHYLLELKDQLERDKKIPKEFYEEYCELQSKSRTIWPEAKEKNDYQLFKPYLEKIIEYTKKYYEYKYPEKNIYDAMLETYEKGMNQEKINKLFEPLKKEIIELISKLKINNLKELPIDYTNDQLYESARLLLDYIGFDNDRGALGIFPHGYTTTLNKDDVRIAFSKSKSIVEHSSTIIHEGGHGIFEQNVSDELTKFETYYISSYAIHESQSRFYENILGRNINFWKPIYDRFKNITKLDLSLEQFMEYQNDMKPSIIRTQADELTYCLHIILRYEIERDLFNGKITPEELPKIWNEKTKQYLGINIENDRDGVLQDVHWSDGSFGYFPSYLIGSIFDGMLLETIERKIGNVDEILAQGRIKEITKFLNENIHQYGGEKLLEELSVDVCGEELTSEPLIKYFKKKINK